MVFTSELIPYKTLVINGTPNSKGLFNQYSGGGSFSVSLTGANVTNKSSVSVKVCIASATIPLTYYGINTNNNTLSFTEGAVVCTATIAPGNYTSTSISAAVQAAMNAASVNAISYTVTLSTNNGRVTFASSSAIVNTTISVTLSTAIQPLGLGTTALAAFNATTPLTVPNIANLIGPTEVHIRCANFVTDIYESQIQTPSTIMAVVPIVGNQFDSLIYQPAIAKQFSDVSGKIDSLSFNITDEFGQTINFNGYGVKLTLALFEV